MGWMCDSQIPMCCVMAIVGLRHFDSIKVGHCVVNSSQRLQTQNKPRFCGLIMGCFERNLVNSVSCLEIITLVKGRDETEKPYVDRVTSQKPGPVCRLFAETNGCVFVA